MMLAILLSRAGESDNCEWYFINISVDVFLGVFLCFLMLRAVERIANKYEFQMLHSGNYIKIDKEKPYLNNQIFRTNVELGDIDFRNWVVQIAAWGLIIIIVKLTLFAFQLLTAPVLEAVSTILIGWLDIYPKIKLVLIMIVIPFILNVFQFWVQDNLLKMPKKQVVNESEMFLMENYSTYRRSQTYTNKEDILTSVLGNRTKA